MNLIVVGLINIVNFWCITATCLRDISRNLNALTGAFGKVLPSTINMYVSQTFLIHNE